MAAWRTVPIFYLIGADLRNGALDSGFRGLIDHVALWDRALDQAEIIQLSGGKEAVARRDLEILGPREIRIQYWKPRGQAYAGDCLPFYDDVCIDNRRTIINRVTAIEGDRLFFFAESAAVQGFADIDDTNGLSSDSDRR